MKKLNELQSYLTRLRGLMLTLIILCSIGSGNVWGAEGDVLKTYDTNSSTFATGYGRKTGDNFVWWGQKNYYGANNATNHGNNKPTAADLPVVKAQNASATTSTTGLYYCYTSEAVANVGALEITFSAKSGSSTVNAYIVTSSTAASNGSATWTKVTLSASSANAQGKNVASANTYRFTFNATETGAKYYGVVFATSSYWRATGLQMKLIEGATATTPTLTVSKNSITSGLTYVSGGGPSAAQTFTVSGSDLSANVTVTAPTNFEVSKDGSSYAGSQTITASGTLSATTIYVRLKSGLAVNSYSGNITVASTGATSKTVSLSGSVTAPSYTVGWSITSGGGTLSTTSGMSTTVTPASGYRYASPAYTVLTGSATVVQSTNTFTATPTANSTIRINMEEIPSHTLSFNTGGLVSIPSVSVLEGATYNISQTPAASLSEDCEYATFVGWTTASSIADASIKPSIVTSVTMSTSDVTLYAVYSKTEGGSGDYELVESNLGTDWAGDYLIAYSADIFADGRVGGTGTGGIGKQYVNVDPDDNLDGKVVDADWGDTYHVTLEEISENSNTYLLKTQDNQYNYYTTNSSNGLSSTTTKATAANYPITVTFTSSSDVKLCLGGDATGSVFRYNTSEFFRYYKDCGQNAVYLYKKSSGTTTYSMSANCNMPTITVSKTSIAFGDKKMGTNYQETFTVSGSDLSADINLSVGGVNPTLFSIDKTSLPQDGGTVSTTTITVTWTPSASYNAATITISSTGATSKTVTLSGTGKWEVTWKNNGVTHATTLVASGTKPTFPSTPTSCDGTSTDFVGWTNAQWSGKIDNVAGKTIHTNNTTMSNVSANGTIYYAVFAEADFEEGPDVGTTIYAENFSGFSGDSDPSGTYTNSHTGTTLYSGSVTYSKTNGSGTTQTKSESLAGGSSPELMVAKYSGTFTVAGIPRCGAAELTLTYKQNGNSLTSSVSGTGYSGGKGTSTSGTTSTDIICGSGSTFNLTFTGPIGNSNVRLDDILITVKRKAGTYVQYLTNCCDKNVTLAHNSPSNGTVTFSPAGPIATCSATAADRQTTMTITPNAGYKLTGWSTTGVTPASVSPAVATSGDDSKSAQAITVTFTQNTTTGTYTANATFTAMVDHFIDKLHETTGYTESDNHAESAKYTVPNLSDKSAPSDETCEQLHYKFVGWVAADDVDSDGTLIGSPTILTGGTTNHPASDKTYWAIWAKEL